MSTNDYSSKPVLLNCLVPSCQNCDLDIVSWKKVRQSNTLSHCPRHKDGPCECTEPYKMIKFPNDVQRENSLKRLWVDLIQRPKGFEIKPWHGICSVHFVDDKPTEVLPFPILQMGLQKWQIVQTLKAYYTPNEIVKFEELLNQKFGNNKLTVTSKCITTDLNSARDQFQIKSPKNSVPQTVSSVSVTRSEMETTLLNIEKLKEPVKITVGFSPKSKEKYQFANHSQFNIPTFSGRKETTPHINVPQNGKEINSTIPGIRIFNSAPKLVERLLPPVEKVEQELVIDETGIAFNTCASFPVPKPVRKRRLGPGRPPLDPNAGDMDDFLYHPDIASKRPYRRKDTVLCSVSKECIENYELCQMLIENLKQMTKNINDLNVRKQQLTSLHNCDGTSSKLTMKIDDCKQCSLLQNANRNSIRQGRFLESQVSSAQLIQNGLLRKLSTHGERESIIDIKTRLETMRNHMKVNKFKSVCDNDDKLTVD